ncbi:MAG: hypothetical protein LH478_04670 [Chitinophagaceae bacterium]|nr:hypothetical protein [Chitinophagaceae bacterium]
MQTNILFKTNRGVANQSGFYEYRLVVQPNKEVYHKVLIEKQFFNDQFGEKMVDRSLPQIMLATFQAREEMEETIIRYLHRVCSQQKGFMVELNNYSGYPPHSIYLRVQNPQPFTELAKQFEVINNYIDSCACPPLHISLNPHIGIASSLNETIYRQALINYGQKTFHEIFMVNELLLVKKNHEYDQEKPVNIFRLKPVDKTLYN